MVLFTHLKIILLQCFQFSIFNFNKISSVQTDPKTEILSKPNSQKKYGINSTKYSLFAINLARIL